MKVECTIRRDGGTKASIGGVDYHFKPQVDGRHVAEIGNPKHLTAFLRIECYKLVDDELPAEEDERRGQNPVTTFSAPPIQVDSTPGNVDKVEQTPAPAKASEPNEDGEQAGEGESEKAGDGEGEGEGDGENAGAPDGPPEEGKPIEEMEHAELIEEYAEVFKRAPHPNAKKETLREKLIEARNATSK